ncbi:MAG TPA: hypothetical protein PKE45_15445 [Caldilineaceae bacterium]|nr:hypothetical protein [Caldilineaceae bacterium]
MIVEFIGSTGAGKTTLIKQVLTVCAQEGIEALVGTEFVLKQSGLNGLKSQRMRAVAVNLLALLAALGAWRKNRAYYRFVLQSIWKLPAAVPWLERLLLAKNILKRIGIYAIIRRHDAKEQLHLVDEGTLHVAHSLFVHLAGKANHQDLARFAGLVPLPHVVVYLRQEEAVLIERILARGHPRVPDHSLAAAAYFVQQAVAVFDELVHDPLIKNRVVVVDGAQQRVTAPGYGDDPSPASVARLVQAGLCVSAATVCS